MSYTEILKDRLVEVIKPLLESEGIDLIEVGVFAGFGKYTVRLLIDYPQGGINIETCAQVNRSVVSFLKEGDLLGEDFTVEVNSPGMDRPLKTQKDFSRVLGRTLCLWVNDCVETRKYLEGELIKVTENYIELKVKDNISQIELSAIQIGKEKIC
jgi:ribosome maturation factor RimP